MTGTDDADMWDDAVLACADLVGRAGAKTFELGCARPDGPIEGAGWFAIAEYQGVAVTSGEHTTPSGAAIALAQRLLRGAVCRCGERVTLSDAAEGCRWTLVGRRWKPSCDVPAVKVEGGRRGDLGALHDAMNRAERRRAERRKKG